MLRRYNSVRVLVLLCALLGGGMAVVAAGAAHAQVKQAAKERHPHLRLALQELREANKELETADHDFGGHHVKAIEAIDVSIRQLEKALKFDKK